MRMNQKYHPFKEGILAQFLKKYIERILLHNYLMTVN